MPVAWAAVAGLAMAADAPAARGRWAYLVYDPADLTAFAVRGANAADRLPGRTDEPTAGAWPADKSERFYLEYPPPALALFRLEAWAVGLNGLPPRAADTFHTDVAHHHPTTDDERQTWGRLKAFARLHIAAIAVAFVGLLVALRAGPATWLAVLPGAVYFGLMRYDVLPALATALAFRCGERGRWNTAGAWLAIGAGLKLYPMLFLPVLWRLAGWRVVAGFAVTVAAVAAASVAWLGVEGAVAPLRVQLGRPPEMGGWGLYGRLLPTALAESSAARLGLLATVLAACCVTRPADLDAARRRCGLGLLAFTQLAVFWSPQWLVWFLPLAVPLAARERRTAWAVAAVDLAGYLSFPVLFHLVWGELPDGWRTPVVNGMILLRTAAWGWLGWRFLVGGRVRGGFDLARLRDVLTPPRGLVLVELEAAGEPLVSAGRALVPVRVRFDPTPDGGLEDVPQAKESRQAVAVFVPADGRWVPTGKLVFNLTAEQVALL